MEKPDYRHRRLLRSHSERPRHRRTAKKRDELSSLHMHKASTLRTGGAGEMVHHRPRMMSALGQKQTYAVHQPMSALHPIATAKADIRKTPCLLYPRKRTFAVQLWMLNLAVFIRTTRYSQTVTITPCFVDHDRSYHRKLRSAPLIRNAMTIGPPPACRSGNLQLSRQLEPARLERKGFCSSQRNPAPLSLLIQMCERSGAIFTRNLISFS